MLDLSCGDLLSLIISLLALIASCVISAVTMRQTKKIHEQSVNIGLYDRRKQILYDILDDRKDVSLEIELFYSKKIYHIYSEMRSKMARKEELQYYYDRLEEYFKEKEFLSEKYNELMREVEFSLGKLEELYNFYDENIFSYYDLVYGKNIVINGREICQEIKVLDKEILVCKSKVEIQIKKFLFSKMEVVKKGNRK